MTELEPASKRAKTSQPQTDQLTAFLTTELSTKREDKPPLRTVTLISPYLNVTELVSVRSVSLQWHNLFSQASCGTSGWSLELSYAHLEPLAQRVNAMNAVCPLILERLGCQRNVFISLPRLQYLDLPDADVCDEYTALLQQLAECSDLPVQTLVIRNASAMFADVLRALPNLENIIDEPRLLKDSYNMARVLAEHTPPRLKHYEWLGQCTDSSQLPQLATRLSALESLSVNILFDNHTNAWSSTELGTLLAPGHNMRWLTLEYGSWTSDEVNVFCSLPSLRKLTIDYAEYINETFFDLVPKLRATMISHLPETQRAEQLSDSHRHIELTFANISDPEDVPTHGDEGWWWWSVVQASCFCDTLTIAGAEIHDSWLRYYDEPPDHTSEYAHAALRPPILDHHDAVVTYVKLLTCLRTLHIDNGGAMTDQQLSQVLTHSAELQYLTVRCNSPLIVHQALTASNALTTLRELDVEIDQFRLTTSARHAQLAAWLQLIRAASSLKEVTVRSGMTEWTHVDFSVLRQSTAHAEKVHVAVVCSQATELQRLSISTMLLMLPNLTALVGTRVMTAQQVRALRLESGLSPVAVFC